jgi:TrmH family RNA methyltransferase
MGAITEVKVHYTETEKFLANTKNSFIYGTFLNGESVYNAQISENGIIVMGNEGNGIRPETEKLINRRIFIPPYPENDKPSDSLNVAIATATILSEFRRRR